jgi:hypothetical protein
MAYRVDGIVLSTREKFCMIFTGYSIDEIKSQFDPDLIVIWGIIPA